MSQRQGSTLATLAYAPTAEGPWWTAVASALDELDEGLRREGACDDGSAGVYARAIRCEPALSNVARRISDDRAKLADMARRLRGRVEAVAGDARQVPSVSRELTTLALAVRRFRRRSRLLFWESFNREIEGQ
jgi:hypothetical protein